MLHARVPEFLSSVNLLPVNIVLSNRSSVMLGHSEGKRGNSCSSFCIVLRDIKIMTLSYYQKADIRRCDIPNAK